LSKSNRFAKAHQIYELFESRLQLIAPLGFEPRFQPPEGCELDHYSMGLSYPKAMKTLFKDFPQTEIRKNSKKPAKKQLKLNISSA